MKAEEGIFSQQHIFVTSIGFGIHALKQIN
jgi:hypothetical protein